MVADLVIALIDGVAEAERALSERRDRPTGAAGVIVLPRLRSPGPASAGDRIRRPETVSDRFHDPGHSVADQSVAIDSAFAALP